MHKRLLSLLLCVVLLAAMATTAHADEPEVPEETVPETTPVVITPLSISTVDQFLVFAENCRLDTYSQNLVVTLENDIDLTGYGFDGIPIFSGTFDGNHHTISGLDISSDGSMQGLFRYLTATALVQNLTLTGSVQPGGSQNEIGGIAGRNEGRILDCRFSGTVSAVNYAGGIAGKNGITGIIENCQTAGSIYADHFVGGIAGENTGVIRNCTNTASVNTTPQQNDADISSISLDTLTNAEAANTTTDIGGIAGSSSGVIRDCQNQADVGYMHIGYNIGGIAGTQSGYIVNCENHGNIHGRKEIGGIVGQMEPASIIQYTEDTLQILQGQLNSMSGLVNQASGNAQTNAAGISSQISILQDKTQTAIDAVETLFPDAENPQIPDADQLLAAQNALSSALNAMPSTLSEIASAAQTTIGGLTRDLNAISGQINAMSQTINEASENLGGSITDVSDQDTPDQLTGKAESCINHGSILGDLNAGGIAGAMAMENDGDFLDDLERSGENSLNFQSEVRSVLLNCENLGAVTSKHQNAGGIVGWQSLGLVRNSTNTGALDSANADYAGGIAGMSLGFIRSCFAKCEIRAHSNVGGIAGSAAIVTDSLSQVKLMDGSEKLGGILGFAEESPTEEETPIARNYYLCVEKDPGAIDGISYSGLAEPLALDAFMALDHLPDLFRFVTIRFAFDDGTATEIPLAPGSDLDTEQIPAIPEKEGFSGAWEGLAEANLTDILFDMTFEVVYTAYAPTIQSELTRDDSRPLVLIEGSFTDSAVVSAAVSAKVPTVGEKETLLEVWDIHVSETGTIARLLLPGDADENHLKLLVSGDEGSWSEVSYTVDGSYLVFELLQQDLSVALVEIPRSYLPVYIAAALVLIVLAVLIGRRKKHNLPKTEEAETI